MPQVQARLIEGQACLQVLDASSGSVRMIWRAPDNLTAHGAGQVRDLFRELFLHAITEAPSHYPDEDGAT